MPPRADGKRQVAVTYDTAPALDQAMSGTAARPLITSCPSTPTHRSRPFDSPRARGQALGNESAESPIPVLVDRMHLNEQSGAKRPLRTSSNPFRVIPSNSLYVPGSERARVERLSPLRKRRGAASF